MPTTITYADILEYLTAIAKNASNPISASPHGDWWSGLSYTDFKAGQVPNLGVQIMDLNSPLQSQFYLALTGTSAGSQMPGTVSSTPAGPFITDPNYTVTLSDGTPISGAQIQQNIQLWLINGFPE